VAMANRGPATNTSQFYITFKPAPNLDGKHTVFGKLVGGEDILDALENLPRKDGTERPSKTVRIKEIVIYHDPFEEYKQRLARKIAHRAEADKADAAGESQKKKDNGGLNDEVNWFGVRIGSGDDTLGGKGPAGGVGKYLNASGKRPREAVAPSVPAENVGQEAKKKKKVGFGDFEGW